MVHSHTHDSSSDHPIHWARIYDLTVGLLGPRGRRLRAMFADDLQLRDGDRVLDVGCGGGRLAMVFAARVAPSGSVDGIDAAAEMIKLATARARRHGLPAHFQAAFAQRLPFADTSFDAVACTLALHHVAEDDQQAAVVEMHRVLKPGGRLLIAEFRKGQRHSRIGPRWLRRSTHGDMINKAIGLVTAAGFTGIEHGNTNLGWLGKVTASK